MIDLTLIEKRVFTLDPDDNILFSWLDGAIANSVNLMGEKKRVTFRFDAFESGYPADIAGAKIYINYALFVGNGYINDIVEKGSRYWSYQLPSVIVPGNDYECTFFGPPNNVKEAGKNYKVKIKTVDSNTFQVTLDFYQTYDTDGYIEPINDQNRYRFTKDILSSPEEFVEGGNPTIFNDTNRDGRIYVWIDIAGSTGSIEEKFGGYQGTFYDDGDFEGVNFKLYNEAGDEVDEFLNNKYTIVKCKFTYTGADALTDPVFAIIRTDTQNNETNFVNNYEMDRQLIDPTNVTGGSKIYMPFSHSVDGFGVYTVQFRIKPGSLTPGGSYRFIGSLYGAAPMGAIYSSVLKVSSSVPYAGDGMDFTGYLQDYNKEFTGDELTCVIEERMASRIVIDYAANKFANDIYNRLGLNVPNDIRKYLKKIDFTIYEEYNDGLLGTVRNILEQQTSYRTALNNYVAANGTTLTFNTDQAEFKATWRNRYESAIQCIQTLVGGINYLPLQGNQYWGGKQLFVEWKLSFFYDDYAYPFTDDLVYIQKINVSDYNEELQIVAQLEADEDKEFFCPEDLMCLKAVIDPTLLERKLINTVEQAPGNILTIKEAEAWVGAMLPQQTTPLIYNQDTDYDGAGEAKFCVDANTFSVNTQYKISAMAKKVAVPVPAAIDKITEASVQKITESNNNKIIE